jgi:hypothetical protein
MFRAAPFEPKKIFARGGDARSFSHRSNLCSARRMGGANGSRECAPDDRLRGTHQLEPPQMMGFAKGSTHRAEARLNRT